MPSSFNGTPSMFDFLTQEPLALTRSFRTGGTPPYTLKVYLNDKVVSQNQGWSTNYVQWRASADQVPAGTSVRVRVTDSSGQTVMSEPTVVEGDGKSASTKKGSPDPDSTGHTGGHGKTSADEEPMTGAVDTKSLMDDPNNGFRTSDVAGAPTGQIGGGMLSAAVMPSDWQPGQESSSSTGCADFLSCDEARCIHIFRGLLSGNRTVTLMPLASASLSAFMASATSSATSGDSAAITNALASTAATASASSAVTTDISNAIGYAKIVFDSSHPCLIVDMSLARPRRPIQLRLPQAPIQAYPLLRPRRLRKGSAPPL